MKYLQSFNDKKLKNCTKGQKTRYTEARVLKKVQDES